MNSPIPFNRPSISPNDLRLLSKCIEDGHISGNGPYTREVETLLESDLGTSRCLLTSSCTHALEMAAILLQLRPGDEVILPSYTFVSTANAFLMHGANLVFVDCDAKTKSITPESVRAALNSRTRAVCVVHYGGVSCEMEQLTELCREHGLTLIEDNAHGLFGSYNSKYLGTFGQMGTLSFHETKNFTCGEGGALLINDPDLIKRAEILREKGTNRSQFVSGLVDKYTWVDIGSSWVLSDLQAAILLGQLQRRESIQQRRFEIYNAYTSGVEAWAHRYSLGVSHCPTDREHTAHLFFVQFPSRAVRQSFIDHMRRLYIHVVFHYQSLHNSPFGVCNTKAIGTMENTEAASEGLVRLPIYIDLTNQEVDRVIDATISFQF